MSDIDELAKSAKTEQERIDVIRFAITTGKWGLYLQNKLEKVWNLSPDSVCDLHDLAVSAITNAFKSLSTDSKRAIHVAKLHNLADVALQKRKVVVNEEGEFQSYDDPDIRGAAAALTEAAKLSIPKDQDDEEDLMAAAVKLLKESANSPALPAPKEEKK